jgi:hypothetical protein
MGDVHMGSESLMRASRNMVNQKNVSIAIRNECNGRRMFGPQVSSYLLSHGYLWCPR